jgi:hypothetical protein
METAVKSFGTTLIVAMAGLAFVLLASGCETTPPAPESVEFQTEESVEATIVAIDRGNRMVTLEAADGQQATIEVPPEARNLAQVQEGDTFSITYTSIYRAYIAAPGESESGVVLAAGVAEEGERPAAMVGAEMMLSIEVISVAEDGTSVTFRDDTGVLDSMQVLREEGQAFARGLKRGDVVVLEHAESVAIQVEEPSAGG